MREFSILLLVSAIVLTASAVEPTWSSYPSNVMYSGEHRTISNDAWQTNTPPLAAGAYEFKNQIYYSGGYSGLKYGASDTPRVVLSLQGYKQDAPADGDTFVGFDVRI